ncbi:MAG: hypothetical protein ACT4UP_00625 [Gammaproteobacteria bacterium]
MRLLALVLLLALPPAAQAYLDPSTGSLVISAIVGLLATIGLAVKTWWYKLKGLFRRKSGATEGRATQSRPD